MKQKYIARDISWLSFNANINVQAGLLSFYTGKPLVILWTADLEINLPLLLAS